MGGRSFVGIGLVLGLIFGVIIGITLGRAVAGGIIGVIAGLAIGYVLDMRGRAAPPRLTRRDRDGDGGGPIVDGGKSGKSSHDAADGDGD